MPEPSLPDPATDPTAPPRGGNAPSAQVVPLRRAGLADSTTPASVADASLAATDDGPELEAALSARPRRRWYLAMPRSRSWQPPVTGALAVIFGTAALFKEPVILGPLAILLALVAGWRGHHAWAVIGLGTGLVGLLTSFWFWIGLALAWLLPSWM